MIIASELSLNQANLITFVMIDLGGAEVTGLGGTFTLNLSKAAGVPAAGVGAKGEIGALLPGWYYYWVTAAESDTRGPLSIAVTGAGCIQQNLEYVVGGRNANAIEETYTVTDSSTGLPVEGALVWFTTDIAGSNRVWIGTTDAFGVARDPDNNLPWLDAGTYYVWVQRSGYTPDAWPDIEVVA